MDKCELLRGEYDAENPRKSLAVPNASEQRPACSQLRAETLRLRAPVSALVTIRRPDDRMHIWRRRSLKRPRPHLTALILTVSLFPGRRPRARGSRRRPPSTLPARHSRTACKSSSCATRSLRSFRLGSTTRPARTTNRSPVWLTRRSTCSSAAATRSTASQFSETTAVTGGIFNADTQNEMTQFFFEMPAQYLDIALHLEASRAHRACSIRRRCGIKSAARSRRKSRATTATRRTGCTRRWSRT